MKKWARVVLGLALTVGCSEGGSDGPAAESDEPVNLDADAEREGETLAACVSASQADVNDALVIVDVVGDELRKFGAVGTRITEQANAVFDMTTYFLEGKSAAPTGPLAYSERGDYKLSLDGSEVTVWFLHEGRKLEEDVLDSDNYLRGLTVSGSPDAPTFTFDEAGPLFSLLAPEREATSPLSFTVDDVAALVARFRALGLAGTVGHSATGGEVSVSYQLSMQAQTVNDALFGDLDLQMGAVNGFRPTREQTLTVTAGSFGYAGNTMAPVGTLDAAVEGTLVDYQAKLLFASAAGPDIQIACAE